MFAVATIHPKHITHSIRITSITPITMYLQKHGKIVLQIIPKEKIKTFNIMTCHIRTLRNDMG